MLQSAGFCPIDRKHAFRSRSGWHAGLDVRDCHRCNPGIVRRPRLSSRFDTGLVNEYVTGENGNFEVLALPIGRYSVSVAAPGFKTWNLASTNITVGERSRLTPVLEVGQVSEQVTVESTAELLQTERAGYRPSCRCSRFASFR